MKNIVIEIEDNGEWIPEEQRDSEFEPFFTSIRDIGGNDLGFVVVRSLVKGVGGSVHSQESSLGGVKFKLDFWIKQDQSNWCKAKK